MTEINEPGPPGDEVAPSGSESAAPPGPIEVDPEVPSEAKSGGGGDPEPDEELIESVIPALEALLFAADEPLSLEDLRMALSADERPAAVHALERLEARLGEEMRGLQVIQVAGGYRMTTRGEFDRHLRALYRRRNRFRPGRAALETLAIVAYRQPITAPEIAEIRGVDPAGVLRTLMDRRMIRTQGRKRVVGKPFLYGTTQDFLVHFGLNSLEDLPSMEEFNAMVGNWAMDEAEDLSDAPGTPESTELGVEDPEPSHAEGPEDEDDLERGGGKE